MTYTDDALFLFCYDANRNRIVVSASRLHAIAASRDDPSLGHNPIAVTNKIAVGCPFASSVVVTDDCHYQVVIVTGAYPL